MSADLDEAVYALLTPTRLVINQHGRDANRRCRSCGVPWPCFEMGTAIEALDLILRVHVKARNQPCAAPEARGETAYTAPVWLHRPGHTCAEA